MEEIEEFKDLVGHHIVAIDEKGRFIVPSKYRERFTGDDEKPCLISWGTGPIPHLIIHTAESWKKFKISLLQTCNTAPDLFYRNKLFAHADDTKMDKQGRITLLENHRAHIGLQPQRDREIVLVGNVNRVEIYSKEQWDKEENEGKSQIRDTSVSLGTKMATLHAEQILSDIASGGMKSPIESMQVPSS